MPVVQARHAMRHDKGVIYRTVSPGAYRLDLTTIVGSAVTGPDADAVLPPTLPSTPPAAVPAPALGLMILEPEANCNWCDLDELSTKAWVSA